MTYKAIVCLFLEGGNDSFNMIAPRDPAGHAVYAAARGAMAVPRVDLLPIRPRAGADDRAWGFHPAATRLRDLFEAEKCAVVANVGTLLQPTTKAQYLNNAVPLPAQLFSHSDQSTLWQLPSALDNTPHGWAGRMGDAVLAMNGGSPLSPVISIVGDTRLLRGQSVAPYSMGADGSTGIDGAWGGDGARRLQTLQQIQTTTYPHVFQRHIAAVQQQALGIHTLVQAALAGAHPLNTTFPGDPLGKQLRMVARMIAARQALGVQRQIFFVRQGGYDTHASQLAFHAPLLSQLGNALAAFQGAMAELGAEELVTTCTMSEFGRTLTSNGDGTDHGWGGHQLVLGGAVRGRRFFGTMPDLQLNGPDDAGLGRIVPTTAVDQMAATLARWFGVTGTGLHTMFPRLSLFGREDLGFLRA